MLLLGWVHKGRCRWQCKPGCALPQQSGKQIAASSHLGLVVGEEREAALGYAQRHMPVHILGRRLDALQVVVGGVGAGVQVSAQASRAAYMLSRCKRVGHGWQQEAEACGEEHVRM